MLFSETGFHSTAIITFSHTSENTIWITMITNYTMFLFVSKIGIEDRIRKRFLKSGNISQHEHC